MWHARNVIVDGVFSHFANAERVDNDFCRAQLAQFRRAVAMVKERWPECCAHLSNSVATWFLPESHFDMVRPGLLLYGVPPGQGLAVGDFRPVMSVTAPVLQVREFEPGRAVSYGQTYITRRRTRVAVLGVGYADGYDRRLSNNGLVGLHGKVAPVIGRICMDTLVVDISDVPGVQLGDRALLWGECDGLRLAVEEVAARAGTISYEVLTRLGHRVPRFLAERATRELGPGLPSEH
ncbi:MAG: alanine racemase [Candidatus Binatia bacterium]|nr:alanine racemase [Candidatus Binatia bacterium]